MPPHTYISPPTTHHFLLLLKSHSPKSTNISSPPLNAPHPICVYTPYPKSTSTFPHYENLHCQYTFPHLFLVSILLLHEHPPHSSFLISLHPTTVTAPPQAPLPQHHHSISTAPLPVQSSPHYYTTQYVSGFVLVLSVLSDHCSCGPTGTLLRALVLVSVAVLSSARFCLSLPSRGANGSFLRTFCILCDI